jgi:hypothetical protein
MWDQLAEADQKLNEERERLKARLEAEESEVQRLAGEIGEIRNSRTWRLLDKINHLRRKATLDETPRENER